MVTNTERNVSNGEPVQIADVARVSSATYSGGEAMMRVAQQTRNLKFVETMISNKTEELRFRYTRKGVGAGGDFGKKRMFISQAKTLLSQAMDAVCTRVFEAADVMTQVSLCCVGCLPHWLTCLA